MSPSPRRTVNAKDPRAARRTVRAIRPLDANTNGSCEENDETDSEVMPSLEDLPGLSAASESPEPAHGPNSEEESDQDEDDEESDEEEDDDEDDDDEDEDDDDESAFTGFVRRLAIETQGCGCPECCREAMADMLDEVNAEEDEDDEDDDDESCDCPNCRAHAFAKRMIQNHFQSGNSDDEEEEEDSEEEEEAYDSNAPTCAVCLEHETSQRPMATLPCCGQISEETSSTRFCEKCVEKCLEQKGLYSGRDYALIGECPRCKHLLTYHLPPRDTEDSISIAKSQLKFFYVACQENNFSLLLVMMACCDPGFIPHIALAKNDEDQRMMQLKQWGLLQQPPQKSTNGGSKGTIYYTMDPLVHAELLEWSEKFLYFDIMEEQVRRQTTEVSELETNRSKHCLGGSLCLSCSAFFDCIPKFRFLLALQLLNRSLTLILVAARFLPHLRFWKKANGGSSKTNIWMATGLNCILLVFLWKILFQVFWFLLYVLLGWLTCKTVGSWMPEKPATAGLDKWLRKISLYGMSGFGLYLTYRVGLLVQSHWSGETAGETQASLNEEEEFLVASSPSSSEL